MEILHCIPGLDRAAGGPSRTVTSLAVALARRRQEVKLFAVESSDPIDFPAPPNLEVRLFPLEWPGSLFRSRPLRVALRDARPAVFHGHGLWLLPVHYMMVAARAHGIPSMLSPRGTLEAGALRFSRWKKRIAGWLFQNRDLRRATCLHVTSRMEAEGCRRYGLRNPLCIVPNGLELAEYPVCERPDDSPARTRTVLFLSRLHPKKGIPSLLEAWRGLHAQFPGWRLVIAGPDESGHGAALEARLREDGSGGSVSFVGPVYGDAKLRLLRGSDLFVLPSLSENFGVVVTEALACGLPAITTIGTPWDELPARRCGWWVEVGPDPLRRALEEAMSLPDGERFEMGRRGRRLVVERYSIDAVAEEMVEVYTWLGRGAGPPASVTFDGPRSVAPPVGYR